MNRKYRLLLVLLVVIVAALSFSGGVLAQGRGGMMGPGGMRGPGQGYGPGGGYGPYNPYGMYGGGMGTCGMMDVPSNPFVQVDPLSIEQSTEAVQQYLERFGRSNLAVGEVMVFDNHSYVTVMEEDTGMGAMELLVDPTTLNVWPEPGPNMMWNLKYGHMGGGFGRGMMGFGSFFGQAPASAAEMDITGEEALTTAQDFLNQQFGDRFQVSDEARPFYGYYTVDVQEDGEVVGMLSVNGYTGEVWLHTWHGQLIESSHD